MIIKIFNKKPSQDCTAAILTKHTPYIYDVVYVCPSRTSIIIECDANMAKQLMIDRKPSFLYECFFFYNFYDSALKFTEFCKLLKEIKVMEVTH